MEGITTNLPVWCWWKDGECVVKIIKRGHYPTTVLVQLPSDAYTEVEIDQLETQVKDYHANSNA